MGRCRSALAWRKGRGQFSYICIRPTHALFCSIVDSSTWLEPVEKQNLPFDSFEVISGSDHSNRWPIKRARGRCCCCCCCSVKCVGLHIKEYPSRQTHLSVVGGIKTPGKPGCIWQRCVCVLLNWLCEQIRKKDRERERELLILGLFHNPPPRVCLSLCSCGSGSWPALRHQETAWRANRSSLLEHLQKLGRLKSWQWFQEIGHYALNGVHLICVGRLEMHGHPSNASSLIDVSTAISL